MSHGENTVAAVVITRDAQAHLDACLASVVGWVDEIVILDSGSTDGTRQIAERHGARFYQNPDWPGFGRQRQIAQEYVTSGWCFWLDADERVTPGLRDEILSVVGWGAAGCVYAVPRLNWFFGRFIRHCGWYPKPVVRLYPTALARYNDASVHERVEYPASVSLQTLSGDLLHYPYADLRQYMAKSSLYASQWARMKAAAGKRSSLGGAFVRATLRFLRMYLLQKGFLDGSQGFLLSVLSSYYTFLKYAELWVLGQSDAQDLGRCVRSGPPKA